MVLVGTRNQSKFNNEEILIIAKEIQKQIQLDFNVNPTGKYSEFSIELKPDGGYIKPGLVSCWVDPKCTDRSLIVASICHELIHYELQINCFVNPQPSSFVNEGTAQSYAEGRFLRKRGDSYISRWKNIVDLEWKTKISNSVNSDKWFLENRVKDKTVGFGNAAVFEWITNIHVYEILKRIFAASIPNNSKSDYIKEICGKSYLEILSDLRLNQ